MPITQFSSFFGMEISPDFFLMPDSFFLTHFYPNRNRGLDWDSKSGGAREKKRNRAGYYLDEKKKMEFAGDFDVFKGLNWRAFRLFSSFTFIKSAFVLFLVLFRHFKFIVKFLRRP